MLCQCILDVSDASSYKELQGSAVFTCCRCQRSAENDLQNRLNTGQSYVPTGGSLPQQQEFAFFTIATFIRVGCFWFIIFIISHPHFVIPFPHVCIFPVWWWVFNTEVWLLLPLQCWGCTSSNTRFQQLFCFVFLFITRHVQGEAQGIAVCLQAVDAPADEDCPPWLGHKSPFLPRGWIISTLEIQSYQSPQVCGIFFFPCCLQFASGKQVEVNGKWIQR